MRPLAHRYACRRAENLHDHCPADRNVRRLEKRQEALVAGQEPAELFVLPPTPQLETRETARHLVVGLHDRQHIAGPKDFDRLRCLPSASRGTLVEPRTGIEKTRPVFLTMDTVRPGCHAVSVYSFKISDATSYSVQITADASPTKID
jgi:hypothetical protein